MLTMWALITSNVPRRKVTPINITRNPTNLWHMHLQAQQFEHEEQLLPVSIRNSFLKRKKNKFSE